MKTNCRDKAGQRGGGFTLIELLTVIVIIALLLTILVPTIRGIILAGYAAKTSARIKSLANGCYGYYEDNGRKYFPGQQYTNLLAGGGGSYTGSQYLAACVFSPKTSMTGTGPLDSYCSYTPDTITPNTNGPPPAGWSSPSFAIADCFPDQMPICYYVSRFGQAGTAQFAEGDNSTYTSAALSANSPGFGAFITNPVTNSVFCDGSFIIISPGTARKYYDPANVTNFK